MPYTGAQCEEEHGAKAHQRQSSRGIRVILLAIAGRFQAVTKLRNLVAKASGAGSPLIPAGDWTPPRKNPLQNAGLVDAQQSHSCPGRKRICNHKNPSFPSISTIISGKLAPD